MLDNCWTPADRAEVVAAISDGLWRYVGRYADDMPLATSVIAGLTGLAPHDLETLRHLHLLLSDEVRSFVDEALPRLLARRRAVTARRLVVGSGPIRGPISWGATTAARARRGVTEGVFASSTAHKHLDTPEARLLACVLRGLAGSAAVVEERLDTLEAVGWGATVARVARAAREALGRNQAEMADATALDAALKACMRSTREGERALARTYALYRELVAAPTISALLRALERRALLPMDDDLLYELWALLGAVKALDEGGWTLQASALIGHGRRAAPFTYRSHDGGATVRLLFGHTPAAWRRASRYRAIFERYALAGATRRPDLVVALRRGRRRRYLLIEVKRTRDEGYIADSIYKVLGYLADFEAGFAGQQGVRGLLLVWDTSSAASRATRDNRAGDDALVLATRRTYERQLRALLAQAL